MIVMNLVLDTNMYSDYVRGDRVVLERLNAADIVYVPVIVIGELKRGFYYGNKTSSNIKKLEQFLAKPRVQTMLIDDETAEQFGRLSVYLKRQGTPIPTNDVWIAALCVQYDVALLTRDGDFERLPQVTRV